MQASQGPRGDAWSGVPRREGALERSISSVSSVKKDGVNGEEGGGKGAGGAAATGPGGLKGLKEEDGDEDRVDAKNAASRLATSTF